MVCVDVEKIKLKGKTNKSILIEITDKETINTLAREYAQEFLYKRNPDFLEHTLIIKNENWVKKFIFEKLSRAITQYYIWDEDLLRMLDNSDIIQKRLNLDLKNEIRKALKNRELGLEPETLLKIFKHLEYPKEHQEELVRKMLETVIKKDYLSLETFSFFKEYYPKIVSDVLNQNMDKVLISLKRYWDGFDKIGRGYEFLLVKNSFLEISKLKDLINKDNTKKIQDFLVNYGIEEVIKRRVRKGKHLDYIKAIAEFLPDEMKKKVLVYLI